MMQGQKNLLEVARLILSNLAPVAGVRHGVFYLMDETGPEPTLRLASSYAYKERKNLSNGFKLGEGLVGQAALEKKRILLTNVPDDYITINTGLGEAKPLQHRRAAGPVRGRGQGGPRARLLQPVQRHAPRSSSTSSPSRSASC